MTDTYQTYPSSPGDELRYKDEQDHYTDPETGPKVTRFDFWEDPRGGIQVRKFRAGWTAKTRPFPEDVYKNEEATFAQVLAWFQARPGIWIVRTWFDLEGRKVGRAWRGAARPIRTTAGIKRLRDRLTREMYSGRKAPECQIHALDLGYDWI